MKADSGYTGIYCHHAEPCEVQEILNDHYSTEDRAKTLFDLGNLSQLGKLIGRRQNFNRPEPNTCVAYGRDCGDPPEEVASKAFTTLEEAVKTARSMWCIHLYVLSEGKWNYSDLLEE